MRSDLPGKYQVLPYTVKHEIPGFRSYDDLGIWAFCPTAIPIENWYRTFADRVIEAIGMDHLEVVRLGDGEFQFWLGPQRPSPRNNFKSQVRGFFSYLKSVTVSRFVARTPGRYKSGDYSRSEWRRGSEHYERFVTSMQDTRILAPALHYTAVPSLYERFFPAIRQKIQKQIIRLSPRNMVPVYFVYALLRSKGFEQALRDKSVLFVTHAVAQKREKIEQYMSNLGVQEVLWCQLSDGRSMYDTIDVSPFVGVADVCFVGAGIGKVRTFDQLGGLPIPCIDAGFVIEVWADPQAASSRPYLIPDPDAE